MTSDIGSRPPRWWRESIRRVQEGKIHVVLLDDEIEGVKACDFVPLFKKINDKIQVIVISSEASLGLVKRSSGGGDASIKP